METENTYYPGTDKKPKACPEVISWNEVVAQTDTQMTYRPRTNMHTSHQRDNDKCDWNNISINQITTRAAG